MSQDELKEFQRKKITVIQDQATQTAAQFT